MRFELLIERLAQHKRFRSLLDDTGNLPAHELVESLAKEFEQIVERYRSLSAFAGEARQLASDKLKEQVAASAAGRSHTTPEKSGHAVSDSLKIDPIRIASSTIHLEQSKKKVATANEGIEQKKRLRTELEAAEHLIHDEVEQDWKKKLAGNQGQVARLRNSQQELRRVPEQVVPEEQTRPPSPIQAQAHPEITDEDLLFLHAAGLSDSSGSAVNVQPIKGLTGIDGTSPLVRVAHDGVEVIVSKVVHEEFRVTHTGVLLLRKDDLLHYREVHEELVNALRCEEFVLPFEFGATVKGLEELVRTLSGISFRLRSSIEADEKADDWSLKLFALDARVNRMVTEQLPTIQLQERGRDAKRSSSRSDIKSLEKILQIERNTAETIHLVLAGLSSASEIFSLVGIGNGTSDDWKQILHVSYRVPSINRSKFFSTIKELQEAYRKTGLLFELHGASGRFNVKKSDAQSQSMSA